MKQEVELYKEAVREYHRACEMASHTHDQHKRREFLRMVAAKAMNLNPYLFGDIPFPGASINRVEESHYHAPPIPPMPPQVAPLVAQPVQQQSSGLSTLGKVAIGAALALGGAGAGAGIMALLRQPAATSTTEEVYESVNGGPLKRIFPNGTAP